MEHLFVSIYQFLSARRILYSGLLLFLFIPMTYFALNIHLEEDIAGMIPNDSRISSYHSTLTKSRFLDKIVLSVSVKETGQQDSLIDYAGELVSALKASDTDSLISSLKFQMEEDQFSAMHDLVYNNLPVYLSENDYASIDSSLSDERIQKAIEADYHRLISPASVVLKTSTLKDPLGLTTSALQKFNSLQTDEQYTLYNGYIFKKDLKTILVFITPANAASETKINTHLIDRFDKAIAETRLHHPDVYISYFGATAVSVANARQIQQDIMLTLSIAVLVILLALFLFYRNYITPFLVLTPVLFGMLFSLTCIYFIKGSLSAIALGAGAIIIGIAIDYSFHVLVHFQHTRSVKDMIKDITLPMIVGSTSTVGALFSLLFVKSAVLNDFGLFSGLSLIGAALFALIFFPHLVEWTSSFHLKKEVKEEPAEPLLLRLIQYRPEKNKYVVGIILLITAVLFYYSGDVEFEGDLSALNYMPEPLRKAEQALYPATASDKKNVYLIAHGASARQTMASQEQAYAIIDRFKTKGAINRYSGTQGLLLSDSVQRKRIDRWNTFWTPEKKEQVKASILRHSVALGFKPETFNGFYDRLNKRYEPVSAADVSFLKNGLLKEYWYEDSSGTYLLSSINLNKADAEAVFSRLQSVPNLTIVDRQLLYNTFVTLLKEDFDQILISSSLLVFLILLISYGRIEMTLITFIPMMISWVWILGFMAIFNIPFNIVNIIISTFIFGIGDDYAIFFTDGLKGEYAEGKKNLPSYKISVFLSAFTTMVGMGVLIFAKHPALKSIAAISIIGIVCVLITSYTLIPLLFKWIISDRVKKGLAPLTFFDLVRTFFAYTYFLFGCLLLLFIGGLLFIVFRSNKVKKVQVWYHYLIQSFVRSLLFVMFSIKKDISNPYHETFCEPAIIISNHQSFMDILLLLTLHPKIILFTNKWVWNSPFFGGIVRMAGCYTIEEGIEKSVHHVRTYMAQGYAVAIFPEGTRSEDSTIRRFHKGAFYLAEVLKIDLLPVLFIHTGKSIRKNDFIMSKAPLIASILPRIKPDNFAFGTRYQKRSKLVASYFREQYAILSAERPNVDLYDTILHSYIYKGPVIEWYYKVKVRLEQYYDIFDAHIPGQARILDIGCGYGFLDYYLTLKSPLRTVTGIDYDADKIAMAAHSYLKKDSMHFYCQDVTDMPVPPADVILLLDVLHYLPEDRQTILIKKCLNSLTPGGLLFIRDGDASDHKKHTRTKFTEILSTYLFRFNKGDYASFHFVSSEYIHSICQEYTVEIKTIEQSKYTSNALYQIKK